MDKKYILLAVIAVVVILVLWLRPVVRYVDDYRGQPIKVEEGNILVMKSGLRVRLLGVKPNDDAVKLFLENNVLHKRITLVHDSRCEETYSKNDALVRAYVNMGNQSVNRLVLQNCGRECYSERNLLDSIEPYRRIFAEDALLEITDIPLYMKQRTFVIYNEKNESKGTGFFINDEGLAVTNTHVLNYGEENASYVVLYKKDAEDSEIYMDNKRRIDNIKYASALESNGMDFTIFTVELEPGESVQSFRLAKRHPRVGDVCWTFGNPNKHTGMCHDGKIIGFEKKNPINKREMTMVYYNIATNGGNSGGPISDIYGQVVAVHEGGNKQDDSGTPVQGDNFGIDILHVRQVLDNKSLKYNGR